MPIGVDIVQQGAAVAGTLDQGMGRCCPSQVEIGPPQADRGNKSENRHGDSGALPMRLLDADDDRSDRFAGAFDRPVALWPACRPAAQGAVAVAGSGEALLVKQGAVLVEDGGGVAVLVGDRRRSVRACDDLRSRGQQVTTGGQADLGLSRPLLSHS